MADSLAEDSEEAFSLVVITHPLGGSVSAHFDAGLVHPGSTHKFRLDLLNQTSEELVIDNVEPNCGCTNVSAVKTKLKPGDRFAFEFSQEIDSSPKKIDGSGVLVFKNGLTPAFHLNFVYEVRGHLRWASDLLMATLTDAGEAAIQSDITISDDVKASDFEIHVSGIDGDFEYSIDRESKHLSGFLKLNTKVASRLYGQLELLDLRSGATQVMPLIVDPYRPFKLLPEFLKFSCDTQSDEYFATLYVQKLGESNEPGSTCLAAARLGGSLLHSTVTQLRPTLFKIEMVLPKSTFVQWNESKPESDRVNSVSVEIKLGPVKSKQDLPFVMVDR